MPSCLASSFADLADLRAYQRAKQRGLSDAEAFKLGDNGIGFTGLLTAQEEVPMCALPPEDWQVWGGKKQAVGKKVIVAANGRVCTGILGDTMPRKANIKNGCGIDLNPAFAKALGLKPPFKVACSWTWADKTISA